MHCRCAETKMAQDEKIKAEKKWARMEALAAKHAAANGGADTGDEGEYESADEDFGGDRDDMSETSGSFVPASEAMDTADQSTSRASSVCEFTDASDLDLHLEVSVPADGHPVGRKRPRVDTPEA